MKHSILFVDDEVDNVDALERLFRKKFRILRATSGSEALEVLKTSGAVSVIISDQRMPHMSGVEFLEKSMDLQPHTIRMLLTGYTDIESVIAAINSGQIYRYITKPWDPRDLTIAVERAVERFEMAQELRDKNAALSKALAELRSLDEAKGHFMILIGHELKTPLTSILNFLDLLKMSTLDAEQMKAVDRIDRSAQRLKEIVLDVLELMAAETETMPVNLGKLAVRDVIKAACADLEKIAREKAQKLIQECEISHFVGDEKIIVNVLRRIIHNAVKFGTPEHEIKISVKNSGDDQAVISVTNHGPALQPEMIERILKPFALNENIMNHSKGLGLGLSLSQALLRRHGSELHIDSKNAVTRVWFSVARSLS